MKGAVCVGTLARKNKGYIIIAGCGYLGVSLAESLAGQEVFIIDSNEDAFGKLPRSFGGEGIIGDAVEVFATNSIHIENAAAVISATGNDNTNILVAHIAKSYYNIPYVTARLHDPQRESVCRELDIDIIYPDRVTAKAINDFLHVNINVKGF